MINTKHVTGRRELHFQKFEEMLADAEEITSGEYQTLGNLSAGQILKHLAMMPGPARWLMRLFMKKKFLTQPMSPGINMPKKAQKVTIPGETSTEEGLAALRIAVKRQRDVQKRALNGALGPLTLKEWEQFHLRHAELHLSFIVPK